MAFQRQPLRHRPRSPNVKSEAEPPILSTGEINLLLSNKVSTRWMQVGLCLGLSKDRLDVISVNHHRDVERCELEMISAWLKQDKEASWTKLAQAIGSPSGGGNLSLTKEILSKVKQPSNYARQFTKYVHLGTLAINPSSAQHVQKYITGIWNQHDQNSVDRLSFYYLHILNITATCTSNKYAGCIFVESMCEPVFDSTSVPMKNYCWLAWSGPMHTPLKQITCVHLGLHALLITCFLSTTCSFLQQGLSFKNLIKSS